MQKRVLLITGGPGIGKTTVLVKIVNGLKADGICVGGMISQEVRDGVVRVGFEITDLAKGKRGWLAHINQKDGPKVGKYKVNIVDLAEIGARAILEAVEECAVVAIDEVGPMELFSQAFKQAVKRALNSGKPVLAVVHAKAKDPLVDEVKHRENAETFIVTMANRDALPEKLRRQILSLL